MYIIYTEDDTDLYSGATISKHYFIENIKEHGMACANFEFYYLIELTKQKIKPLSRWEKPLTKILQQEIKKHGLHVATTPRKTHFNRHIYETIFSTSSRYLDLYHRKFY